MDLERAANIDNYFWEIESTARTLYSKAALSQPMLCLHGLVVKRKDVVMRCVTSVDDKHIMVVCSTLAFFSSGQEDNTVCMISMQNSCTTMHT